MDENRRIRVWTSEKGTRIEIVRSTGKPEPNHTIERHYQPITRSSASRVSKLIEFVRVSGINVHEWGVVCCWFIP